MMCRILQSLLHKRSHLRLLRSPAASDVECLDAVLADEGCQSVTGVFVASAFTGMHKSATTSQGTWITLGAAMENVPSTNSAPFSSVPKKAPVEVPG